MDTYMTVTCYGDRCEEAADAAEAEIKRLDDLLSTGNPASEISLINSTGSGVLSEDSRAMVEESMRLYEITDGLYDITIYPVMKLWGFTDQNYRVPEKEELEKVRSAVGSNRLKYDNGTLTLDENQGIDLGAIAKGYTSARLTEIFGEYDLSGGVISLGGNVQLYGTKPNGQLWKCGIREPDADASVQDMMGVLETEACAVITSGAYERYFTGEDGNTYHHIINPHTGYPAVNGLKSVTIVSSNGMLADALSTACFVMGKDGAEEFWRTYGDDFEMILMTEDQEIYITEGIAEQFSSDHHVNVINR